ncbi:MAG: S41 family peptidase [Thermovirgaceae bacterium]|nr:S41 family peptidase [Synergistales bacterium]HPC75856.1 S41 family peptidase [Synergistales bacterium]HRS48586.1 S41 family peptidase [Thermovirgaceae bacterium]HRU90825.1 S41 family peptidase [Thermovirgaceae bacterium]
MLRSMPRFFCFILSLLLFLQPSAAPAAGSLEGLTPPERADFSALNWTEAFKLAHEKLSREYAFTEWKGIDWDYLYERFAPEVQFTSAACDERSFYLLLRQYVFSIPDGHMALVSENTAIPAEVARDSAGGGFGLTVVELDNTRAIAATVSPGGQAALAGIEPGAEIITWNCLPIAMAISGVPVDLIPYRPMRPGAFADSESPQATTENHRLEQAKLLVRGPVGSKATLVFRNPGSDNLRVAILTALDDEGATLDMVDFAARPGFSDKMDFWMVPEGYGYIRLRPEVDRDDRDAYPARILERFRGAIRSFIASGAEGVIVDIRGYYDGLDELAADICGFFFTDEEFYESLEVYEQRDGGFAKIGDLTITPREPHFDGPVVALINPGTKSSGEGIARSLSLAPKGSTVGFHGTNGSFGLAGGEIVMPGGYTIKYPYGFSLDRQGRVQIDSRFGEGGATPDLRVPKNAQNVLAFAEGHDVELEYAVDHLNRLAAKESGDNGPPMVQ